MVLLTWLGILFCLSQSAVLSGLNLALFAIGKLELFSRHALHVVAVPSPIWLCKKPDLECSVYGTRVTMAQEYERSMGYATR